MTNNQETNTGGLHRQGQQDTGFGMPRNGRGPRDAAAIRAKWRRRRHAWHARPGANRGRTLIECAALVAYVAWIMLMVSWVGAYVQ